MKFLQKLGKALMLPVAVLPICGILMGIGYWLCPATMQGGEIQGAANLIGLFLVKAGGALIDNMAILFAIGVGVGMSEKNDGTGGIAALASWLMLTTLLSTGFVTTIMPSIAEDATKTLAFNKIANPFIGIIAGIIGSMCYNKFKDTKLPDWLSFFSGKRCVAIIAGVVSILASVVLLFVWPLLFGGLVALGEAIVSMACYIVMAVSLNLVVGLLGELSLGHAGFMSVGLFTGCLLSIQLAQSVPIGVRMPLSMLLGGVAAAVVGLLVGLPALRLKGDYLAIVTLACGEIIKTIINNLSVTGGAKGLDTSEIYADTRTLLPFAIVLIFLVVLVMMNLKNSRHGRAIMAIRDNRIAAESNGVNVTYYKLMVFVLAAFFAGMAGVLYGHTLANIKPAMFDYNMSIEILVIVVLGGMGSIRGSIIATIILRALPEVLRQVADYRMLAYSVLLIVIMLLNSSPQFAEWKGRWSLKALLSLGKARKEKTKKEAAKK